MNKQIRFSTNKFDVERETSINPGCYGEGLANWVRGNLGKRLPHLDGRIIDEDWGWIVIVREKPFRLWIGCANEPDSTTRWNLFVDRDANIFQMLFRKDEIANAIVAIEKEIEELVNAEPSFSDVAIEWEN